MSLNHKNLEDSKPPVGRNTVTVGYLKNALGMGENTNLSRTHLLE